MSTRCQSIKNNEHKASPKDILNQYAELTICSPIVLFSLISGAGNLSDGATLGRLGLYYQKGNRVAMALYLCTTAIAVAQSRSSFCKSVSTRGLCLYRFEFSRYASSNILQVNTSPSKGRHKVKNYTSQLENE